MKQTPTNQQSGFTLIEIISVLMLLGIVSAIAVSKVGNIGASVDLAAEIEILKMNLRYAQNKAMNSTDTLQISLNSGSYTLQQNNSGWVDKSLPSEIDDTDGDGLYETRNFAGSITKSSGPAKIRFDSWGIPVQSNTVTPETANIVLTLTDGTNSKSLTVTKNTGYIP